MPRNLLNRRTFVGLAAAAVAGGRLRAQAGVSRAAATRVNVAAIDRERILAAADAALAKPPRPLTSIAIAGSPGGAHDFYSTDSARGHSDAVFELAGIVPALAAGATIVRGAEPERAARYARHAKAHLDAWFADPATRMTPALAYAGWVQNAKDSQPAAVVETTGLAEVAVALPFLGIDVKPYAAWFGEYSTWLNEDRQALLARDLKDHQASSWLLQAAAYAALTGDEKVLAELRHRFKATTIRAQILSTGFFPHELTTANPYRNSLFNLDLLCGVAVLLTTRFDSVWEHELQDGPGMRSAVARYAPYIQDRHGWPYPSDETHFHDLPCRRPALLFAARAFAEPEYVGIWQGLKPVEPASPELLRTFPIRQPVLWVPASERGG